MSSITFNQRYSVSASRSAKEIKREMERHETEALKREYKYKKGDLRFYLIFGIINLITVITYCIMMLFIAIPQLIVCLFLGAIGHSLFVKKCVEDYMKTKEKLKDIFVELL